MLDKLYELTGGNRERMALYIKAYVDGIGECVKELEKAYSKQDISEIRLAVHSSKPLYSIMGFEDLWSEANSLEEAIYGNAPIVEIVSKTDSLLSSMKKSLDEVSKFNQDH